MGFCVSVTSIRAGSMPRTSMTPASPACPPGFAVERRHVRDDHGVLVPRSRGSTSRAVLDDREDAALGLLALVAHELHSRRRALRDGLEHGAPHVGDGLLAYLRALAPGALLFEGALVAFDVDREPALLRDDLREVDGETERVVELEGRLAAHDDLAAAARRPTISSSRILRPRSIVSRKRSSSPRATLAMSSL